MSSLFGLVGRVYKSFNPPTVDKDTDGVPVKFGILGAAAIAPIALIDPAKSHPEVVVYAVAARDKKRAEVFASKHGIEKAYGGSSGYQEMIDDPQVDAVYNALPNGLHYEWTMKALAAGKHVLLEKPATNTAEESGRLFDLAESKGLVLLEAFHYRFHPGIQRVKAILDSGELGKIKSIHSTLILPRGVMGKGDIRFDYSLGGGALMDMGCYTLNSIRYLASGNPTSVISAVPAVLPGADKIDRGAVATLELPSDVTATLACDLAQPWRFGILPRMPDVSATVKCEGGEISLYNFVGPTFYHSITVTKSGPKGASRVEKAYTFAEAQIPGDHKDEAWWTTYRYQLEAFVDQVKGRKPQTWVTRNDTVDNMKWIEAMYAKSGLGSRPKSAYVDPSTSATS